MKHKSDQQTIINFEKLVQLVKILRSKDGCDWDKSQTSESLIPYFIEEVYELIDSIDKEDHKNTKEELGDIMLHLVFQAQLSNEKGSYTINDVLENINTKLAIGAVPLRERALMSQALLSDELDYDVADDDSVYPQVIEWYRKRFPGENI